MRVERVLDVLRLTYGRAIAQQVACVGVGPRGALGQAVRETASGHAARGTGSIESCGGERRSRDNRAGRNTQVIGTGRSRPWAWSALNQMPAVTDACVVMDTSRTKRATFKVLVRMSPSTVALALLGKPNQGERLR